MPAIKLTLEATTFNGQIVTFTAPCSCAEAANELIINNDTYAVVDAMGNAVTNDSNAWASGALVTVTLDVTNKKAYLQSTAVLKHTHAPTDIGAASNPNLLDNWYFADPINQRGQTSYNGSNAYCIDRWRMNTQANSTFNVVAGDGLVLKASGGYVYFTQVIEASRIDTARTYTYSLFADGGLVTFSGVFSKEGQLNWFSDGVWHVYTKYDSGIDGFSMSVRIPDGAERKFVAAKLELGSVQTLAHKEGDTWVLNDPPPNKQQELAKCQRYQVVYGPFVSALGMGQAKTSGLISVPVHVPVTMRATPTATLQGKIVFRNKENYLYSSAIAETPSANPVSATIVAFSVSGATAGVVYEAFIEVDGTSKFILDANL